MKYAWTAVLGVMTFTGLAVAQEPERGPGRGPPPEAIAACSGLASGAACSVTFRGQTLSGTCEAPPNGTTLACRPTNMPPPPEGGRHFSPPAEAVTACASLSANATCAFSMGSKNLTGTCATPPGSTTLACRPAGMHHGPPAEAVSACASLSANAACSFSHQSHTLTGTCASPPGGGSGALACRPSGPPQESIAACASLAANAACTFTHDSRTLTGTCGAPPDRENAPLACRPSGPPPGE